jgi:CheY-like chemotaxis protein
MSESNIIPHAKQILLIDSEVNVRAVVQTCLSTLGGWTVFIAESTQDGLSQAIQKQPDLIILDIAVSEPMNGLELLELLKTHPATQSIPIVLLSAEARWLNMQRLQPLGVIGAIAKPFNAVTLPTQIANLLGWTH